MKIKDKTVLITGASRGLGRALAFELARQGARVVLAARPSPELQAAEREIRSNGGWALALPLDISRKEAIHPFAAQLAELAGPLDILIHNASTLGPLPLKPLLDTECEELETALATNLVGPFRLTKALLGPMILREGGIVLNISSDAAVAAYPNWGAYSVTKSALDHLSRIWAAELPGSGVRFLSVDPGEMDTRMHAQAIPDADPSTLERPEAIARLIARILTHAESIESGSRLIAAEWALEKRSP